jgi:hypothetical protein
MADTLIDRLDSPARSKTAGRTWPHTSRFAATDTRRTTALPHGGDARNSATTHPKTFLRVIRAQAR